MLDPRRRWWTRDRLVVVALVIHTIAFVIDAARASDLPPAGLPTLLVDLMLVLGYATVAPRLGALHVMGDTRGAFLRDVWYRHWAGEEGLARRAWSGDRVPAEDRAKDSLHGALADLEGVRLQDPAGAVTLALSLLSSLPGLWLARPAAAAVDLPFWSIFLPAVVVFLLDPLLDLRAGRELLDRGSVARVASLTPRSFRDLGISPAAAVIAVVLPSALVLLSALRDPGRLVGPLVLVAYLGAVTALSRWMLRRLPFLHFPGPPEISALLDVHYRAQRIWLLFNSVVAAILVWLGLVRPDEPLIAQLAMAAIVGMLVLRGVSCRYVGPVIDEWVFEATERMLGRWMPPRSSPSSTRRAGTD